MSWGIDNIYPAHLISLVASSPVTSSIIRAVVNQAYGGGIRAGETLPVPNTSSDWCTLYKRLLTDYKLFGYFAIQCAFDEETNLFALYHQPIDKVRIGQIDEYGNVLTYKVSSDWSRIGRKKDIVEFDNIDNGVDAKSALLVHFDYIPGLPFYTVPDYYSSWDYIRADASLQQLNT
jgi:hypothetical protein